MRREEFSISLHSRSKFAPGKIIDAAANSRVPIRLRQIHRLIIALHEKRAPARTLRDYAECDRFWPAQLRRRFIEINQTGSADALDVSTVRHEIEIGFQDFAFRIMSLQLERAQDLFELPGNASRLEMKPQPRELHRNCRSTGRGAMKSSEVDRAT